MIKKLLIILIALTPSVLFAQDASQVQANLDLVWVITAGALVFLMQAGFGLLESGMSRTKNSVNVIMKNYCDVCLGTLIFFLVGFGLMFGNNQTGFIGTSHFFFNPASGQELGFAFFQTMFAATAVTIASGAMAERTQFPAYLIGACIITALIYPIYGSWVWGGYYEGGGWLADMGFIDFAGSTVVHSVGGWCALAGILVLGPRLGRFTSSGVSEIPAHNMMYVALGGFLLWFGWFGFNAGSTVAGVADIGLIAYNTQLSAAAGAAGVLLITALSGKKLLASTTINGSIAGLVAITAGCASMEPPYAVLTGFVASGVYLASDRLLLHFKVDDVVGAVPVHGFCGAWGTLAAGIFFAGDMFNLDIIFVQLVGVVAAFLWVFPVMLVVYFLLDKTVGLRASTRDERAGLDYTEHDELGYPEFQTQTLYNDK